MLNKHVFLFLVISSLIIHMRRLVMSFTYRHRKEIFLITIVIILLSIGGIYFYNTNFKEKKKKKDLKYCKRLLNIS